MFPAFANRWNIACVAASTGIVSRIGLDDGSGWGGKGLVLMRPLCTNVHHFLVLQSEGRESFDKG
jgi:hypothetical protein